MNRGLQIFLQKSEARAKKESWRPSVVCVGQHPLDDNKAFRLMTWLSSKYGFGTYIHLIRGYYSRQTHSDSQDIRRNLIFKAEEVNSNVYIDTLISPSLTSAIAQVIQLPSISGKENNMILFEFLRESKDEIDEIIQNFSIASAGDLDVCILSASSKKFSPSGGIHLWITQYDEQNRGLMILMSYIILSHPDWFEQEIKLYGAYRADEQEWGERLKDQVHRGRLPIAEKNIEIIQQGENQSMKQLIGEKSSGAGLTILGFLPNQIKNQRERLFEGFEEHGDILFVTASDDKTI